MTTIMSEGSRRWVLLGRLRDEGNELTSCGCVRVCEDPSKPPKLEVRGWFSLWQQQNKVDFMLHVYPVLQVNGREPTTKNMDFSIRLGENVEWKIEDNRGIRSRSGHRFWLVEMSIPNKNGVDKASLFLPVGSGDGDMQKNFGDSLVHAFAAKKEFLSDKHV